MGELEEEMKRMEEEDQKEQEELRRRIKQLEHDVENFSHAVSNWQERYQKMELECARERQLRQNADMEVEMLRKGLPNGTDAVALPPRQPRQNGHTGEQDAKEEDDSADAEEVPLGCGKCSKDTRCQCIDEAFEISGLSVEDPTSSTFKRPHSPPSSTDNKRVRQNPNSDDDAEIDFTAQFATSRPPMLMTSALSSSVPATGPPDLCGFCSTGGICICAELAKENHAKPPPPLTLTSSQPSANGTTSSDPCVNGPGSCAQCLSSAQSTLFCKSVASYVPSAHNTINQSNGMTPSTQPDASGATEPTLTCADAFMALKRHPGFDQATSELSSWVPQLAAVRKPASKPDRTAYDIEAASVMSVLKFFDRRFGKPGEPAEPANGTSDDQVAYESNP